MSESIQRNISQVLEVYHTYLLSNVSRVRILGETDERELKDVFVELSIADQRAPQQRAEFLSMWDAGLRKRFNPFAVPGRKTSPKQLEQRGSEAVRRLKPDELLRNRTKAIVTGAPGCGKTTLFKYLALQAKEKLGRLVVWLELKAIDKSLFAEAEKVAAHDGNLLLQELWLKHQKIQLSLSDAELNLLRQHWHERLAANEITVLLDGFDELQDEIIEHSLNRCVREFAASLHDNTLLISTRPYAQHKLGSEHLRELEIEPLDQRQIEAFLNCYYPNDGATKSLLKTLRGRSSLRELLHVPLLLGIVLRLHRENKFTDGRLELYETIIADLVHGLDRSKSVFRRFKINDERLRLDFLKFLAFECLLRDPLEEEEQDINRVVFSYDLLKEKARAFLAQERSSHHPRDLAEDVLATTLLREISPDMFAFTHLTLQEFLAAQAFAAFYKVNEQEGLKIFCHAYHNTSIVELEVLPMILGSLTGADKLYAEIERWPDSLTFANLRLRARGLAYGAKIKQQRLAALCEKFADTVMWRDIDEHPYRGMILGSFANARGSAESYLIATLSNLLSNSYPDPYARMSPVEALAIIGSESAVDLLLKCLKDDDPTIQVDAIVRLGEIRSEQAVEALVEILNSNNVLLRAHAATALGRIGSEKAIEPLRLALKDSEGMVRGDAIEALQNIGTEIAAKALTVALREEEEGYSRQKAVLAIGEIGSENFIDDLISCLKDSDSDLRSYIAQAFKLIGSDKATLALQSVIRSDDSQLRRYAVEVLKLIASNGAIELLLTASQDEDSSVRKTVAEALHSVFFFSEMTGDDDENDSSTVTTATRKLAVKCLIGALQDEDVEVRAAAANSLTNYHDQSATPQLQEALHDESEDVRANAARTLGFYRSKGSVGPLIKALEDESSAVRAEAAGALGQLGSAAAIDPLLQVIHDKDQSVRRRAVVALGNIGVKSAVDQVLETLQDEDYKMRACAAIALGQIGEERAFEPLLEKLSDREVMVREYVVEALSRIGGERSLDALAMALDDDGGHVRISATEEIAKISSERSIDLLEVALRDLDLNVTKYAAQALSNIGSERAIKILVAALRYENHHTRGDAAEALAQIATQPVVEAIFRLICDPSTDLRPYASWYLARCDELKLTTAIVNSLVDERPFVRRRSAQIVGYYSDEPHTLERLSTLAEHDPDASVRDTAKSAAENFAHKMGLLGYSLMGGNAQSLSDNQSRELYLVGEVFKIVAEAGHIFRPTSNSDWGIDGEIEFKNDKGEATGNRVYLQLKAGDSYLRKRKRDGKEIFNVKNIRLAEYWKSQAYPVLLVIRDSKGLIRWMNVKDYLLRQATCVTQIEFQGTPFTSESVKRMAEGFSN